MKNKKEKLLQSTLTEEEDFYLTLGTLRLTDEQWEELWEKYPDQAPQMLINIGKELVAGEEQ